MQHTALFTCREATVESRSWRWIHEWTARSCPFPSFFRPAIDSTSCDTAILFFSHRPEREWQNKWYVENDYAKNRRVAEAFYRRARAAVDQSGLPVCEISGREQRGRSFGARLANAFADVFAQGYDRVIAVGSDCPRLDEVDWAHVRRQMGRGHPVIGPTPGDEGTYLIGMSQSQFDRDAVAQLPWKSDALVEALVRELDASCEEACVILAPRDDVNSQEELLHFLQWGAEHLAPVVRRIQRILGGNGHFEGEPPLRSRMRVHSPRTRSPPFLSVAG